MLIPRKHKNVKIQYLKIDGGETHDRKTISQKLNEFFVKIGPSFAFKWK